MLQVFYLICTGSISASECKQWLNHTSAAEIRFSFAWLHCQLHISREEKLHFNGDPRWHLLCAVTSVEREWSITLGCFHLCQSVTEERSYTKAFFFYSRAAGWGDYGITQLFHYCGCGARFNRWNILLISQRQTGACSPAAAHGGTVRYAWKQLRGHGFCPVPSHHGFGPNPLNKQLWSQLAELSNGICLKCERVQFPTCQLWKMNFHMLHICH